MTARPSRYEALARLGTGGMATVFVGRSRGAVGFTRLVALKRAHPHVRDDALLAASLEREARLASRLHHANVVSVLDVEDDQGEIVLAMDYVEGCTLRDLTTRLATSGAGRPRAMIRIMLDAAAGLEAAHRATDEDGHPLGIVHRDVSPSNVLVGLDGVTRISDFGIAKAEERSSDRTETGVLKGKVGYMAPEYVEHHRANAATDQFALGVVAWEVLAGDRLFRAPTELETLKRVVIARVPPLASLRPELAPLDPVIARALARTPSDRFPSAGAFAIALEDVARAYDLVGTHAEVAMLVSELFGEELTERRRLLRAAPSLSQPTPPSMRDDVATASVLAGAHAKTRRPTLGLLPALTIGFVSMMLAVIVVAWTRAPHDADDGLQAGPAAASSLSGASGVSGASGEAPPPLGPDDEAPTAFEISAAPTATPTASSPPPAPSSPPSTSSRGARRTPGSRTSPAQPGLVPKKAPPNPYPTRP